MGARLVVLALALAASACTLEDNLVRCGELACPLGMVCSPIGCTWPDQLDSCANQADGMTCQTEHFGDGVCLDQICRELVCGDGVIVPGEVCDDSNQKAGDGCSADCLSTESCGNGIVDGIAQEECDNSVLGLSHDGCTSTCLLELPAWSDVTQTVPFSMDGLVYDTKRHRTVGIDFSFNIVWEFDGAAWHKIMPLAVPDRRYNFTLGYDDANARVVMFGGYLDGTSTPINETWTWDGVLWKQESPASAPPAREQAVMAFDGARNELVMFGGYAGTTKFRDTWVWTGSAWSARNPVTSPNYSTTSVDNEFRGTSIAFDPTSGKVVLFTDIGRTWLWDGVDWTLQPLGTDPSARFESNMVTYPGGGVMLYGGYDLASNSHYLETWRWNAGAWSQITSTAHPPWLFGAALDTVRNRVVGHQNGVTWEWNGTNWVIRNLPSVPSVRSPPGAYLATTGRTVMFADTGDTWEWDGSAWTRVSTTGPSARVSPHIVGMTDHVLLFGGYGANYLGDTWEWNGTTWTKQLPTTSPPARTLAALSYDRARGRAVLFGGANAAPDALGDTWEWDGTTWTQRAPVTSPPGRLYGLMAYDEIHARTLLVGGFPLNGLRFNDVWSWDGTTWTDVTPKDMPPTDDASLVWNPQRGAITLLVNRGYMRSVEVWEWDGAGWRSIPVTNPLSVRNGLGLVTYDAARSQLFEFGDSQGGVDTYVLRYDRLSVPTEACIETDTDGDDLAGCADPDCWARCTPTCPPLGVCDPGGPRCGDGTCGPLEDHHLCPTDC